MSSFEDSLQNFKFFFFFLYIKIPISSNEQKVNQPPCENTTGPKYNEFQIKKKSARVFLQIHLNKKNSHTHI